MPNPAALQERLAAIAGGLAATEGGLALLGLGSAGADRTRLDRYSDLDFFAIVQPGRKARFLEELDWLEQAGPLVFRHRNTVDGFKLLYADDIFCEMAVFEPGELAEIPYTAARVIWQAADSDLALPLQNRVPAVPVPPATAWLVDEALTNLYVGLARWGRGEKWSAAQFIQGYAAEHALALAARLEGESMDRADPFGMARRFEGRQPGAAAYLPAFMPGYERSPQAARAILAFLEQHFPLNEALRTAVLERCA